MNKEQKHFNRNLSQGPIQRREGAHQNKHSNSIDYNRKGLRADDVFEIKYKLNTIMSTINQKMIVRLQSQGKVLNSEKLNYYINKLADPLALIKSKLDAKESPNVTRNRPNSAINNLSLINKPADSNAITSPDDYTVTLNEPEVTLKDNQLKLYSKEQKCVINRLMIQEKSINIDHKPQDKLAINFKTIVTYIQDKESEIERLKSQLKDSACIISRSQKELKEANEKISSLLQSNTRISHFKEKK